MYMIKINQLAFIREFIIEKKLKNCNIIVILIKTDSAIKILDISNYNKIGFYKQQYLISKLMYLLYKTRSDIAFTVQLP